MQTQHKKDTIGKLSLRPIFWAYNQNFWTKHEGAMDESKVATAVV